MKARSIHTSDRARMLWAFAITSISSSFAAPSTGGACNRTSHAPSRVPATPDFPARGIPRTLMTTAFVLDIVISRIMCPFHVRELDSRR